MEQEQAAQRLAISRARQTGMNLTEATMLTLPPISKIAQIEGVGCMAVFGGSRA